MARPISCTKSKVYFVGDGFAALFDAGVEAGALESGDAFAAGDAAGLADGDLDADGDAAGLAATDGLAAGVTLFGLFSTVLVHALKAAIAPAHKIVNIDLLILLLPQRRVYSRFFQVGRNPPATSAPDQSDTAGCPCLFARN